MRKSNSQRLYRGAGALILASVFNHFADRILGIKIEAFSGNVLQYFSPLWVVDMFLVPFLAGVMVSAIYGFGGKWLSYFPPLFVRALSYIEIAHITGVPPGDVLIPLGWWGFFVILTIESSALGGVIGEVMIKRTYGRTAPQKAVAKQAGPNQR